MDIFFEAFDDFRCGEKSLSCKSHDPLFVFCTSILLEEFPGSGKGSVPEQGKFQEGGCPLQQGAFRREDIQGGKQVVEGIIFCFPGAADNQAAHQQALDACLQWPFCGKTGSGDGLLV